MSRRIGWLLAIAFLVGAILLLSGCLQPVSNTPPVAGFSAVPLHGYEYAPLAVQFDAGGSTDPDGRIVSFTWEFGDGERAAGLNTTHTYSEPGIYTVALCVRDNRGAEDTFTGEIIVREIPEGQLLRRYEWEYQGGPQYLEFLFPAALYQRYHSQERQPFISNYKYEDYVLASLDDPTLEDLAEELWKRVERRDEALLEYTLSFVQGAICHTPDPEGAEYPLYPLETLIDEKGGDCEDTTILYVSLVRAMGFSVSMAHVDTDSDNTPDHVLARVPVSAAYARTLECASGMARGIWKVDGKLYALAETACHAIPLGCDPWGLDESDFKQIWDFEPKPHAGF